MDARKIFQILLVTLIVLFSADMVLKILNSRLEVERPRPETPGETLPENRETRPYSAYSKITERNLFQKTSAAPPADEQGDEDLDHPVTDLKLTLKGTVVGSKERSFAVIEDGKLRTQNLYHVDDSITSGVTLSAIHTDRVVINRNGRKELLLMFQEDRGDTARGAAPAVSAEPVRTIQRREIQQAVGDLKSLMRDVRIIPHFTAGQRDGFTVTYVRQGSRLEELGLQKNDIVKEINGTPAADFRNIFEIFNKYGGDDTLELGIERDNQIMTITYSVE